MPKTKFQNIVFALMMTFIMVYAMICYNIALNIGGMTNEVFVMALGELKLMWPIAFVLEVFVLERAVIYLFERIIDDKYYIDGGIYQNCPIDMFIKDGYDEVYVIRNWINRKLKYDKKSKTKINIITVISKGLCLFFGRR